MFLKISLLIALSITTKVFSKPLSNESEASEDDVKSKRQIQFINFIPGFMATPNYKPCDSFTNSNTEQGPINNNPTQTKCIEFNWCPQQQNNSDNSLAFRTVSSSNEIRPNSLSNNISNRWLLMYVPNPFVGIPPTYTPQYLKPIINATRINSGLLNRTPAIKRQNEDLEITTSDRHNKAACKTHRRCKCYKRISKLKKQGNSDNENENVFNENEFETVLDSDEIRESFETQDLKSSDHLMLTHVEDKILKADNVVTGTPTKAKTSTKLLFNAGNANTDHLNNCTCNKNRPETSSRKITTVNLRPAEKQNLLKTLNSTKTAASVGLQRISSGTKGNSPANKIDVRNSQNSLKSIASSASKSIKDSSLNLEDNHIKHQNSSIVLSNSKLLSSTTNTNKTHTDLEHHLTKSANNTVTNILIIQKTISSQNSKSIGSNHTSSSSTTLHQLESNDALLHSSIKDALSNSSITVLFSNHDNNKPSTVEKQLSESGITEKKINEKGNMNTVKSDIEIPSANVRNKESNDENILSKNHNEDAFVEPLLSEIDADKCSKLQSTLPLSIYLHKIEESIPQPKNNVKENWKIIKATKGSGLENRSQLQSDYVCT